MFASDTEFIYILIIFCLLVLSLVEREVLKSQTITVGLSISPCSFISFCFTYFAALLIHEYTFRIDVLS